MGKGDSKGEEAVVAEPRYQIIKDKTHPVLKDVILSGRMSVYEKFQRQERGDLSIIESGQ